MFWTAFKIKPMEVCPTQPCGGIATLGWVADEGRRGLSPQPCWGIASRGEGITMRSIVFPKGGSLKEKKANLPVGR